MTHVKTGFSNKSRIQCCIIHHICFSTRYVSSIGINPLMSDLHQAINDDEAKNTLVQFRDNWAKTYPSCVRSWEDNLDIIFSFFAYPCEVRRIINTTKIIEVLNRQFRNIIKNKPSFPNDDSLMKMPNIPNTHLLSLDSIT